MKIATFNINNVNNRLANLLDWVRQARPDVACLQELKAPDANFPIAAIEKAGYDGVWRGEKSWNGVAILARDSGLVLTRTELPGDPKDEQSRYIEAAVNGVLVATLYAPNGNPQPGPKFKYKLAWMKRLIAHAAELYALDAHVVLALENALAAGRFPAIAETLRLYRSIATMDKKAPLPRLRSQKPTWDKAAALAREWELSQLSRRLEEL